MQFFLKVSKYSLFHFYFIIIATIPVSTFGQKIIDISEPEDILASPTIVLKPSTLEPNCHTYTGCGVMVVKYPKHHYKPKRHRIYYRPC